MQKNSKNYDVIFGIHLVKTIGYCYHISGDNLLIFWQKIDILYCLRLFQSHRINKVLEHLKQTHLINISVARFGQSGPDYQDVMSDYVRQDGQIIRTTQIYFGQCPKGRPLPNHCTELNNFVEEVNLVKSKKGIIYS